MVLINCKTEGVPPEGWGPIDEEPRFSHANLHLWEYNTTDITGRPVDVSKRNPAARVLSKPKDAELITDYSKPEFVLGGWMPVVR